MRSGSTPAAGARTSCCAGAWVYVSIPASAEAGEMGDQQKMRASDRDRQQVVDRLRSALEDGRLTMEEYVDRMEVAYQAATYGDLARWARPCRHRPRSSPGRRRRRVPRRRPAVPPAQATWPACGGAQGPVDHVAGRRVGQRGRLGPGQRYRRSPGLPLAGLGRPARTGRRCSPCRLASRCSGASGRSGARGRSMADQVTLAGPQGPQTERPGGAGSARLPDPACCSHP